MTCGHLLNRFPLHLQIVAPDTPLIKHSMYWGYTTRLAKGIPEIFSECPFSKDYDLIIGTSEHGTEVSQQHMVVTTESYNLFSYKSTYFAAESIVLQSCYTQL